MDKVKIGVFGAYRGSTIINFSKYADNAEVVAVCDRSDAKLKEQRKNTEGMNITFYKEFDEFIKHDMDAVVLANYATEHAPFAIKAMKMGKHVLSECLPVQTMKEAVELVETVEETGKIYAYGENFCFMPAPYEMKKLYAEGKIGEFEYGECDYNHNMAPYWHEYTYGDKNHWRNNRYSTFYCTHSIGPLLHITGLRPVSVTGFETTKNERNLSVGSKGAQFGMEIVTLENGGIIKSVHGGLYSPSVWYAMYGSKGAMESRRDIADKNGGGVTEIYISADDFSGSIGAPKYENYLPKFEMAEKAEDSGHFGSDFYLFHNFVEKVKGNPDADIVDVYEALDMFLPGLFAFRSILDGGTAKEIPNLRDRSVRDKWRNDTACTDPKVAGDMLLPTCKSGTPDIDDGVYEYMKELWDEVCRTGKGVSFNLVFEQGNKDKK